MISHLGGAPDKLGTSALLSQPAKLGNVYAPNGGYQHSPLGGGVNRDLVDMAGDPAADDALLAATAAAAATTTVVDGGVLDIGTTSTVGDPGGGGGEGGAASDGPGGDGPGGDGGDGGSD